jgi:[protein-PII] uridylyltransferase
MVGTSKMLSGARTRRTAKKLRPRAHNPASSGPGWQWHRDRLCRLLARNPAADFSPEEIDAHFDGMPARYWDRVSDDELVWGLQAVHRFLRRLAANENDGAVAVMDSRHFPQQGCTKVLVSTWDRLGLLTKLAGYISALRLNVLRAEVYTRSDNIVLDVFWLCDADRRHVADTERLQQLAFLLEGGLSEPPRFVSTWAVQAHKLLPPLARITPVVTFDNTESPDRTMVTVEASERPGLLHDMLEVLSTNRLNITEALIDTIGDAARDIFYVTDEDKQKVFDGQRLKMIERAIVEALE